MSLTDQLVNLNVAASGTTDANGAAVLEAIPSGGPIAGNAWLIQHMLVQSAPARPGMIVQVFAGENGVPIGPVGNGAAISYSQIFHPGGGDLVLQVSGCEPGDIVTMQGTGLDGFAPAVGLYQTGAATVQALSGGTSATSTPPAPTQTIRTRLATGGGGGTQSLVLATFGQQLFLFGLLIVPVSDPPAAQGRIVDPINGVNLLTYPVGIAQHPLPFDVGGVPVNIQNMSQTTPSTVLEAINSAGDTYDYYATYALVG